MSTTDNVTEILYIGNIENAPVYSSSEASGADIKANITDPLILKPGERVLIPTGLHMAVPSGYELQIRPRSGLALKKGITVLNTPGTIDSDYRGEIGIILINMGLENTEITPGERIAQMVVAPVTRASFIKVEVLPVSERGSGGFGSTGQR